MVARSAGRPSGTKIGGSMHGRTKDGQQLAFVKDGAVVPMILPTMLAQPTQEPQK